MAVVHVVQKPVELREGAGLSQRELAGQLGVYQPAVARWVAQVAPENHQRPTLVIASHSLVVASMAWRTEV